MLTVPRPSISRQLVLAVAVPLVLSFALTVWVLDTLFRESAMQALRERLDEEVVALITAAELTTEGRMYLRLPDQESRLRRPASGQYATVRNSLGRTLWRSPSLEGRDLDFGALEAVGRSAFFNRSLPDGTEMGVHNRGLQWDYAPGNSANLIFSVAEDLSGQKSRLSRFRQQLIAWFGVLTLLLLGVLGGLLRRVLRPVRRLEREIADIDAGRRAELGPAFPRELAGVARSLNALVRSEQQRIKRYRDTLGNLAHSLKTPLVVMRTVLAAGTESGASAAPAALDHEIDRIAKIVDHHLQRAATSGGVTLGQPTLALGPLIMELRAALRKVHAQKDLAIEIDVAPGSGFVGDQGDITELLGNLMDNACKWCRGRILVRARFDSERAAEQNLVIEVEDDGPGIALADRGRVLNRGERADERAPGHGLGLAMVVDTVTLYGGELVIRESVNLHGACVEIALPGRLMDPDVLTSAG